MSNDTPGPLRLAASHAIGAVWWYFLIRGLLLLGAGIFVLFKPGLTGVAFVQLIGFLVLADGVLAMVAGLMGKAESRFWSIIRGVLMLVAGIYVFLQPSLVASITVKTILYILGPVVIIGGVLEIISSLKARKANLEGKESIVSGVLITLFGILLVLAPLFFGKLILQIIGVVAIVIALILLFLAWKFHRLSKRLRRGQPL